MAPGATTTGLAVAGIVLIGAVLRFTGLDDQSLWADETYTVDVLGGAGTLWGVPDQVEQTEAAPPPYYLLAWVWVRVFGDGDAGLRSLSALLGTATIAVVYLGVRELASRRAGLIAAALCACSPILVWYSQEARVYALYVLLAAGSFWLFARALRRPSGPNLAGWAILSALAIASYYLTAALVLVEAAILLWRLPHRRGPVLVAVGIQLFTIGALLDYALDHRSRQDWIDTLAPLPDRLGQTLNLFAVGTSGPAAVALIGTALVLAAAGAQLLARGEPRERMAALTALAVGGLGLAAVCAGALVEADYVLGRNLLFVWVPLAAAASIALGSSAARRAGILGAVALCALGVWLVLEVKRSDELQRVDYRSAAELIGRPPRGGDRVVVVPGLFLNKALSRYLDGILPAGTQREAPPIELVQLGYAGSDRGPEGLCWWGAACGLFREPIFEPPRGYRLIERSGLDLWTLVRFRAPRPRDTGPQGGGDSVALLQGR